MKNEFRTGERWVGTYYFSWYNVPANEHIVVGDNKDYLSVHPTPYCKNYDHNPDYRLRGPPDCSGTPSWDYRSRDMHSLELQRMVNVGIDVCFFDYWHFPAGVAPNSLESLEACMGGLEALIKKPAIAMFLETVPFGADNGGILAGLDLSTPAGGEGLFACIDGFFSRVPSYAVAKLDGQAMVMLYTSTIKGMVPSDVGLARCKQLFAQKYGYGITFIGNNSWKRKCPKQITYTCSWGAAMRQDRLQTGVDFVQVAPGYNYRGESKNTPPNEDKFRAAWETIRTGKKPIVMVESWNECHESTAVIPTLENGTIFMRILESQIKRFKKKV